MASITSNSFRTWVRVRILAFFVNNRTFSAPFPYVFHWVLLIHCTFSIGLCVESYDAITSAHYVKKKLFDCMDGVVAIEKHERDLFRRKILQDSTQGCPGSWELLQLEETLLQLASEKDVTMGIVYFYGVPTDDGNWVVRSVSLSVCLSVCLCAFLL